MDWNNLPRTHYLSTSDNEGSVYAAAPLNSSWNKLGQPTDKKRELKQNKGKIATQKYQQRHAGGMFAKTVTADIDAKRTNHL
jgi:hypothetical protein